MPTARECERQVVQLLINWLTRVEIARQLGMGVNDRCRR